MARLAAAALTFSLLHMALAHELPTTSLQSSVGAEQETGNGRIAALTPRVREDYKILLENQTKLHAQLIRSIKRALGVSDSPLLSILDIMLTKFIDENTPNLSEDEVLNQCNGYLEKAFEDSTSTEDDLLVGCSYRMTCTGYDPRLYPPILVTGECATPTCHHNSLHYSQPCGTNPGRLARLQFNGDKRQWEYLRRDEVITNCRCFYLDLDHY